MLRGRLLGLARGWGLGVGPAAVLACLPGEQHDLGLIAFGLALRARGWRVIYLGLDAPIETIKDACREVEPSLEVVHAVTAERVESGGGAATGARGASTAWRSAVPRPLRVVEGALALDGGVIAAATRIAESVTG